MLRNPTKNSPVSPKSASKINSEPSPDNFGASSTPLLNSNPIPSWTRWLILALASVINFGLNYSSQNPQALQPSIQDVFHMEDTKNFWDINVDIFGPEAQENEIRTPPLKELISVYSFPNIILPLFGGLLADKIGIRFAVNLFGALVFVGQGVFTLGAYYENFEVMVLGRFVFGLGGESLTVTQLPLLAKWFKGGELAFAYGLAKCAVRLGKSANSSLTPMIYLWTNSLSAPLFAGLIISLISFISGLIFCQFDQKADQAKNLSLSSSLSDKKAKIDWKDLKNFPRIFYFMLGSYACLYAVIQGFSNILNKLLVARFGFDVSLAGNIVMIYYLASAVGGPFVGLIVDNCARKTQLMLAITVVFFVNTLLMAFVEDGSLHSPNYHVGLPLIGIIVFNTFYTILFWACVAVITDKSKIGLGTGIITCVTNLSQTILPLLLGEIHDRTHGVHFGYFWPLIALTLVIGIGFFLNIGIHFEDKKNGGVLNFSKQESKVASEKQPLLTNPADNENL